MRVSTMACANIPFLSTPSGWRATLGFTTAMHLYGISIHALRVEGDSASTAFNPSAPLFLSTPSGWRATKLYEIKTQIFNISIHALRVEGDQYQMLSLC